MPAALVVVRLGGLLLVLLLHAPSITLSAEITQEECEALSAASDDARQGLGLAPCTTTLVNCVQCTADGDNRLVQLQPVGPVSLNTTLPPQWSTLTALTELNLGRRDIRGPLPPQWSELRQLRVIGLGGNNLTGTLPSQWSALTRLSELSLWENQLSGPLPASWSSLAGLQYMYLQGSGLCGPISAGTLRNAATAAMGTGDTSATLTLPACPSNPPPPPRPRLAPPLAPPPAPPGTRTPSLPPPNGTAPPPANASQVLPDGSAGGTSPSELSGPSGLSGVPPAEQSGQTGSPTKSYANEVNFNIYIISLVSAIAGMVALAGIAAMLLACSRLQGNTPKHSKHRERKAASMAVAAGQLPRPARATSSSRR